MHLQKELLPIGGNILFLEVPLPSQSRRKTNRFCVQLKRKGGTGNGLKPEVKYLALAGNLMVPLPIVQDRFW